jgi:hypothetical protein
MGREKFLPKQQINIMILKKVLTKTTSSHTLRISKSFSLGAWAKKGGCAEINCL